MSLSELAEVVLRRVTSEYLQLKSLTQREVDIYLFLIKENASENGLSEDGEKALEIMMKCRREDPISFRDKEAVRSVLVRLLNAAITRFKHRLPTDGDVERRIYSEAHESQRKKPRRKVRHPDVLNRE